MPLNDLPIALSDGHWVSEKVNRVVELLRAYDEKLDVAWIPPENREPGEEAFQIIEHTPRGPQPIFAVISEEYMDERILEKVILYDTHKHSNVLSEMDARNQARRAIVLKEKQDEMMEAHDLAASILKSPKTRYRHNGVVYE